MDKVAIYMPVRNEIRFIETALNSIIGEADRIIISDNASDDGTSDICQSFASKYPEIDYYRQKENLGIHGNGLFCLDKVNSEYARPFSGHHVTTYGSTKDMLDLMESSPDIVHVYSKYAIFIGKDSNILWSSDRKKCREDLKSESVFTRTGAVPKYVMAGSLYYGLYKTEDLKNYVNSFRPDFTTDQGLLAFMARKGKIAADSGSVLFFRWNPPKKERDYQAGITRSVYSDNKSCNKYTYIFAIVCDHYSLAKELEKLPGAPDHYAKYMLNVLIKRHFGPVSDRFSLENMPDMAPQRKEVWEEVFEAIHNYQRTNIFRSVIRPLKRAAKYILPYGIVSKILHQT
jgi:glycosyltransferase involved in cell wall biosynthesis